MHINLLAIGISMRDGPEGFVVAATAGCRPTLATAC